VPPLTQLTEAGVPVRRVARLESFDAQAVLLIDRFVAWRLMVKKAIGSERTLEVSHEAIFRSWSRLRQWIEEEKTRLRVLRDLEDAARAWQSENRSPSYLDHRGRRLRAAYDLTAMPDFERHMHGLSIEYLSACWRAQVKRRTVSGLLATVAMTLAIAAIALLNELSAEAELADLSTKLSRGGYPTAAISYAIAGSNDKSDALSLWPSATGNSNQAILDTGFVLKALLDMPVPYSVDKYHLTKSGTRLFTKSSDGEGAIYDLEKARKILLFDFEQMAHVS
jgi:hypothetical protein